MKLFSQTTLDYKTFRNATILLAILIIPMSYIHETGHAIVCASQGNEFKIGFSVNGGSLVCLGQLENPVLFYAFGGIFAAIVALMPLTKFDWIKKNIPNAMINIMDQFHPDSYTNPNSDKYNSRYEDLSVFTKPEEIQNAFFYAKKFNLNFDTATFDW